MNVTVGSQSAPASHKVDVPRLLIALVMAMLAVWYATPEVGGLRHFDFGQVWYAARAVLARQDPYPLIGPGRAFEWPAPLFYPLPAALIVLPLAPFPAHIAQAVFVFCGTLAFAWVITRHGYSGLWAFASFCVLNAIVLGQWSLILSSSVMLAPLGMMLIAKPTVGLALFAARPTWWALWGA